MTSNAATSSDSRFQPLARVVLRAVLRGAVLGGALAPFGVAWLYMGLVSIPVTFVEGVGERRPKTWPALTAIATITWIVSFVGLIIACFQAVYTRALLDHGVVAAFDALAVELKRLASRPGPSDRYIAGYASFFGALALSGACVVVTRLAGGGEGVNGPATKRAAFAAGAAYLLALQVVVATITWVCWDGFHVSDRFIIDMIVTSDLFAAIPTLLLVSGAFWLVDQIERLWRPQASPT